MRYLITGGSGFIGGNIVASLVESGKEVLNVDSREPKMNSGLWVECDILELTKINELFQNFQPDVILHCAARTDLNGRTLKDYDVNILGTNNIIEAARNCVSVKRVIFFSSMLVCKAGDIPQADNYYSPTTVYGESKVKMENLIKQSSPLFTFDWAIVRPTSIWGPGFGEPYRRFFDIVYKGRYIKIGRNSAVKTYGYIGNTLYQLDCILSNSRASNGKVFYLGDYTPVKIDLWAELIAKQTKSRITTLPFLVLLLFAKLGDVLSLFRISFPLSSFRLTNMTTNNIVSFGDLEDLAPKLPFSLEEGTLLTIQWLEKNK